MPAPVRTAASPTRTLATGARVVVRDEEWIVRSVKPASSGHFAVHVTGTSELVRGKDAIFLTELDAITELRPEETSLVADASPQFRDARLYLEALLRSSPPTDDAIYLGHRAALKPADYQLQPAAKALRQPRPRILMADGVGLGKTIEAGVLLAELIRRGRGDRILVVALKSILAQFQEELWARFAIPLVRLDSVGIQRVQSKIPSNQNPFYFFDKVIISIDTLKKDAKYRRYLEQCRWDAVVIDECQNVAIRNTGGSQRARLGNLLATTTDALILTSATPHDGSAESFASLIDLLEPTAIADPQNYSADEVADYFLRRFKKDVAHEAEGEFRERELTLEKIAASPPENAVFESLHEIEFLTIAHERGGRGMLFRTLLLKAFLSSPAACASTITNRLNHKALQDDDEHVRHDRQALEGLASRVAAVTPKHFAKFQELLRQLRGLGLDESGCKERVVLFSERIDTLEFLREQLRKELGLKADQVAVFHGTLDDRKQMDLVNSFGSESSPIRVLLASDAASEGINLHYYCHRMIHFDLPWSLITLEQRNGRIDRFGQHETPEIRYLLTIPDHPDIAGDLRVLERLIEKEDTVHRNLGDVAWLMNLHDREKEEERIGRGIEQNEAPEEIIPEAPQHTSFLDELLGETTSREPAPVKRDRLRLFADDLAYARDAVAAVLDDDSCVDWLDDLAGFRLRPTADLLRRYEYLPPELRNDSEEIPLTVDRGRVMQSLEDSRKDEERWPEWQLFWELHPVARWLDDRVLAVFGRHEAPVIRVERGLGADETAFVFYGVVSNRRGQPVVVRWFAVRTEADAITAVEPFEDTVARTGLDALRSNPARELPDKLAERLAALRAPAVESAREHMVQLRKDRASATSEALRHGQQKLTRWRDGKMSLLGEQLSLVAEAPAQGWAKAKERRIADERAGVERQYQERRRWIEEGVRTVEEPYLRLAAVLIAREGDR